MRLPIEAHVIHVHFMTEGASTTTLDFQATKGHCTLFEKKSRLGSGEAGEAVETEMQT